MTIQRAYKIELKPNNKQISMFKQACGVARFAFNWGLNRKIQAYEQTGKSVSIFVLDKELNAVKKSEFPWMYQVSKCAPQQALRDLDNAYARYFQRCKQKKSGKNVQVGFPKFKKKGDNDSFRVSNRCSYGNDWIRVPNTGKVRFKQKGYLPTGAKINSFTISTKAGRWFVSFQVEEILPDPVNNNTEVLGIDVGLKSFITTSDGTQVNAPKPLAKRLKNLRKRSKRFSRKQKGSSNRNKAKIKLQREHYKIACIRRDFLHKLTTSLVKAKLKMIVVENLNIQGMIQNRKLARSIADVGWGEFVRQLEYKCLWNGVQLIKADTFYPSSKLCSGCGTKKADLTLKDRTYDCTNCGLSIDRDYNAALNLKKYPEVFRSTDSSSGINDCGQYQPGKRKLLGRAG